MSKHKESATKPPIPLPDPDDVRRTFDVAMTKVKERRGFYLTLATVVVLIIVGVVFVLNLGPGSQPVEFVGLWKRSDAVRDKLVIDKSARAEIADLAAYLEEIRGTRAEATALWLLGAYHYREAWTNDKTTADERRAELKKSIGYLEQLEKREFDESLLNKPDWYTIGSTPPSVALLKQVRDDLAWVDADAAAEPTPNPSIVAVLRTSEGDVHMQFYDLCPEHMKNFVSNARKGTYNGTLFYAVSKESDATVGVVAGDPLTFFYNDPKNKQHVLRWGTGGAGYEIAPEDGRYRIAHRAGVVTTTKTRRIADVTRRGGSDWDNALSFMIMTGTDVDLDKRQTPFARVVEGLGVVEKIGKRKTAGDFDSFKGDPDFSTVAAQDLLVEPVTIHKVIVYENGKALPHDFALEDGEKSLSTLSQTPAKALEGDALFGGRKMRAPGAKDEIRPGLDIPFPDDVDPAKENPEGARRSTPAEPPPEKSPTDKPEKPADSDATGK